MGRREIGFECSQVALVVKNLPANAGDVRGMGLIPGLGRSPRGGHGNLLQYSCLEHSMDKRVHEVAKSQTACMHAWQNKPGVSLVSRKVRSLHSGPQESIMTCSCLNDTAGGHYLHFTPEATEALLG